MKKLIFLLFLLQTTVQYAQQRVNPDDFATKFAASVNKHIAIFPKQDLELLESTTIGKSNETIAYTIQLLGIPVSEAFITKNPKSEKLLKELYASFQPLEDSWTPEDDDTEEMGTEILDALGKQTNGTATQYLFIYCLYTYDDQK